MGSRCRGSGEKAGGESNLGQFSRVNGSARARFVACDDLAFAMMLRVVQITTLPLTVLLPCARKRIAATIGS